MGNFSFNSNIPAAANNPSNDQPVMLINNQSTESILNVDLVGFDQDNGGTHKYMTVTQAGGGYYSAPPSPGADGFVAYTGAGSASAEAYLYLRNNNRIFPGMAVRAFGVFTTTNTLGAVSLSNGFNVVSITAIAGTSYQITLQTGAVTGNNICVFTQLSSPGTEGAQTWSFANPVLTIGQTATPGLLYSFVVLQA